MRPASGLARASALSEAPSVPYAVGIIGTGTHRACRFLIVLCLLVPGQCRSVPSNKCTLLSGVSCGRDGAYTAGTPVPVQLPRAG